jgi:hypothetical protein
MINNLKKILIALVLSSLLNFIVLLLLFVSRSKKEKELNSALLSKNINTIKSAL